MQITLRSRAQRIGQDMMIAFASGAMPKASTLGKRIWTDLGILGFCLLLLLWARLFLLRCSKEIDRNKALTESLGLVVSKFLHLPKKTTRWQVPWNISHAFESVFDIFVKQLGSSHRCTPDISNFRKFSSATCQGHAESHLPMAS